MLREKDAVVADEKALSTLINNYFVNVTADLDLKWGCENFYDLYNIKKKIWRSPKCLGNWESI